MQQVELSYRSTQASVTSLQYQSSRQDLSVRLGQSSQNLDLSRQQRQIIDEVGISQEAVTRLREAQELANQLQNYLDYLNGKTEGINIQISPKLNAASVEISGHLTKSELSFIKAAYRETNIDIVANYDDNDNLQSLSVSKSKVEAQYVRTSAGLQQTQFYLNS